VTSSTTVFQGTVTWIDMGKMGKTMKIVTIKL